MADRFILGDLTSHRRGFGVQSVINAAARRALNSNPPSRVIWIVPSHLAPPFAAANPIICDGSGPQVWSEIERQVALVRSRVPDAEILVVTWEHFIYERAWTSELGLSRLKWFDLLNEECARRTPAEPIDNVISGQQAATVPPSPAPPPPRLSPSSPPSGGEIEELVRSHLRKIGATAEPAALYRSQLRPALVRNNPTLAQFGPMLGQVLKNAIDSGIDAGRLAQPQSPKGQERLYVVERRPEALETPAPTVRVDGADATTASASRASTAAVYGRSAEFRKRLTDQGLFCEKRERDILFEALSRILKQSPKPISKLRRELPKVAQDIANERGVSCADFKRVVNFFLKLLLMSGVLLSPSGEVVARNVRAEAAPVARVDDSALDRMEQYMLEQILKKSDVKDREHWQLAHAIFRQFDQSVEIDGMLDRVASLIAALGHRFILTDDGRYEYTEAVGANVVPLRA
jgi:hypothetical protein